MSLKEEEEEKEALVPHEDEEEQVTADHSQFEPLTALLLLSLLQHLQMRKSAKDYAATKRRTPTPMGVLSSTATAAAVAAVPPPGRNKCLRSSCS